MYQSLVSEFFCIAWIESVLSGTNFAMRYVDPQDHTKTMRFHTTVLADLVLTNLNVVFPTCCHEVEQVAVYRP